MTFDEWHDMPALVELGPLEIDAAQPANAAYRNLQEQQQRFDLQILQIHDPVRVVYRPAKLGQVQRISP